MKKTIPKPIVAWAVINPDYKKFGWRDPFWEPVYSERYPDFGKLKIITGLSIFLNRKMAKVYNEKCDGKIVKVKLIL